MCLPLQPFEAVQSVGLLLIKGVRPSTRWPMSLLFTYLQIIYLLQLASIYVNIFLYHAQENSFLSVLNTTQRIVTKQSNETLSLLVKVTSCYPLRPDPRPATLNGLVS